MFTFYPSLIRLASIRLSMLAPSPVAGGLQFEHFRVTATETGQRIVVSFFCNAPVLENHDSICHAHRREAVRNKYRHLPGGEFGKALKDFVLAACVEGGRGLIE